MFKKLFFMVVIATISVDAFPYRNDNEVYSEVEYVIDGDTVQFDGFNCRLAYVDTPESGNNPKAQREVKKYGIEPSRIYGAGRIAKKYTESHIRKGETYRVKIVSSKKDVHGRSVCEIFFPNGKSFNERIVRDGFAVPFWRYLPMLKKPIYYWLAKKAQREEKGLWRTDHEIMMKMDRGTKCRDAACLNIVY